MLYCDYRRDTLDHFSLVAFLREIMAMKREEAKLIQEIKRAAKTNPVRRMLQEATTS